MNYFNGDELKAILNNDYRVYLCGNLSIPQEIPICIPDDKLEIGTSYYKVFTADIPHYHKISTEYNFVVKGSVKLYLYDTKEVLEFGEGSLYVLPPDTKYATKNASDTQVLFIKCPGGNDKTLYKYDDGLNEWLSSWEK